MYLKFSEEMAISIKKCTLFHKHGDGRTFFQIGGGGLTGDLK